MKKNWKTRFEFILTPHGKRLKDLLLNMQDVKKYKEDYKYKIYRHAWKTLCLNPKNDSEIKGK